MKPKPVRIVNIDVVRWVSNERDGICLVGLYTHQACSGGLDPHHIDSKGSGGGDVPQNLITLCREHHNQAQEHKISKDELREILTAYFGYEYQEAV